MPNPIDPNPEVTVRYQFDLPTIGADFDYWGEYIRNNWQSLDAILWQMRQDVDKKADAIEFERALINRIYPVGAIYLSIAASANPNTMFPGTTWTKTAEGRMLIGSGGIIPDTTIQVNDRSTVGVGRVDLAPAQVAAGVGSTNIAAVQSFDIIPPALGISVWERIL